MVNTMASQSEEIHRLAARRDWEKARQAAIIEEIRSALTFRRQPELLSFEQVRHTLRLSQKSYRGLQDVPLDAIRGSVGRYKDFTARFLPRVSKMRDRWIRVSTAGEVTGVPPIELYQVGEAYFVADGNHRVSVARQANLETIQAHVWEYPSPAGLSVNADLDEVLIRAEYAEFLDHTGLKRLRPGAEILFTVPGGYRELAYMIELYQSVLSQIDGEAMSYEDAVTAWYDIFYTPAVQIIRERGALRAFPGRTEADLFIWVWEHEHALRVERGKRSLKHAADRMIASQGIIARLLRWLGFE